MSELATYTLLDPIEIKEADNNVRKTFEIKIVRRLKAKDMKGINMAAFANGEMDVEDMLDVLSPICDVPSHVLDELTFDDLEGLTEKAEPFFMRGSTKTKKNSPRKKK